LSKGLYVHIPFCDRICAYCDFPKTVAPAPVREQYLEALKTELDAVRAEVSDVDTVYVGGGTPSSLGVEALSDLCDFLASVVNVPHLKEFTVEANPNDVDGEFARMLKAKGVTRLSLGVQSGEPRLLGLMGRTHGREDVERAMRALHDIHFYNVNLDFIYALPTQTVEELGRDLDFATRLQPTHLSFYTLILEPRTILYHEWKEGRLEPLDEETEAAMAELVNRTLPARGYLRYEVSNFAIAGFESKHNLLYWDVHDYLGVGMGAHSLSHGVRFHNETTLSRYLAAVKKSGVGGRIPDPCDPVREACVMGLRKASGIDVTDLWLRFKVDVLLRFPRLRQNEAEGLVAIDGRSIRLTEKGFMLMNYVERSFA